MSIYFHLYIFMYTCAYVNTYIQTHTHTHTNTHTHTHTCTQEHTHNRIKPYALRVSVGRCVRARNVACATDEVAAPVSSSSTACSTCAPSATLIVAERW